MDRLTKPNFTNHSRRLARWLGVSHRVGSDLCYCLITDSGKIISKTSVEHVTRDDYLQEDLKKEIDEFNGRLEQCLSEENFVIEGDGNFDSMYLDDIDDDDNNAGVAANQGITPTEEEYGDMLAEELPEANDEEAMDKYLSAELCLDLGTNNERHGHVCKRLRGLHGEPIGRAHPNPLFDTREYEIEFTDGTREKYQANVIAENMYAEVDDEGHQYLLLQEITDHHKDNSAVPISEGTVRSANGTARPKVMTRGWELLVQWKDGSVSWRSLRNSRNRTQ